MPQKEKQQEITPAGKNLTIEKQGNSTTIQDRSGNGITEELMEDGKM